MKFSGWRLCMLVSMASVLLAGWETFAHTTSLARNKVIIHPLADETIDLLKQEGISKVDDYGSYWLVEVNDQDLRKLKATYGNRVIQQDHFNRIDLEMMSIDTDAAEPVVPLHLQQAETKGRRLRIVQFKGPVRSEWFERLKSLPDVEVVHYVPNNAYLVFIDAATEKKLNLLRVPDGPIQWVGAYHPYYKLGLSLQKAVGVVDVHIAVVDSTEGRTALDKIVSLSERSSLTPVRVLNHLVEKIRVNAAALGEIARLPEVVWIDPIEKIKLMDEVQALILASDTNGPAPGIGRPLPPGSGGQRYLDFVTSAVGGGLSAFTNSATYPIIDIADSGFYIEFPGDLDFFEAGDLTRAFRVKYAINDLSCGPFTIARVDATNGICIPRTQIGGADAMAFAHGSTIASVIAGFNTNAANRDASGFQFGMGVSPFGLVGATRVFQPDIDVVDAPTCSYNVYDDFCVDNFVQLIQNEYFPGGRISNNSWGEGLIVGNNDGLYNATCQTYDIGVRDSIKTGTGTTPAPFPRNQELIIVFANGNAGVQGDVGGFGETTITPPATAKNVISVGATESVRLDGSGCEAAVEEDNSFNIWTLSSLGPTRDGRFKPEIVAPGTAIRGLAGNFWTNEVLGTGGFIEAMRPPGNVEFTQDPMYVCSDGDGINIRVESTPAGDIRGTSFAAPAVSGGIQLLWWYFQNRLALLQPSPAMAKAYLLNSARYLPLSNTLTGVKDRLPSVAQGMGMMDLRRMFDGVKRVIRDESTPRAIDTPLVSSNSTVQQTYFDRTGQSYELEGIVAENGLPFRVTLAWTDAPGVPGNAIDLVNNLDLEVTVGGQLYRGNRFVGPDSVTGDAPDDRNPVESVFLDPASNPSVVQGAPWKVVIKTTGGIVGDGVVNVGPAIDQDFALVVYNSETNSATLSDSPNGSTNDSCQAAQVISNFPYSVILSNFPGTAFHNCHPSPSAGTGGKEGFWEMALPTAGTIVNVDTFGSSFNTLLSVWKGSCGALAEEVSNNNASNTIQSAVTFTADGTNDYYIVAEGLNNAGGILQLNVDSTAAPVQFVPASLDFGSAFLGATGAVLTAVLTNGTVQPLTVNSIVLTGADPGDFLVVEEGCAGNIVPSGGVCTVKFQFAPTAIGNRSAQLVANDNAIGSPRLLQLSGTGLPASPLVCLSTGGSLVFTNQGVNTSSAAQSFILTNCGTAALTVSNVFFTGSGSNDFSVVQTCTNSALTAGSTCTLNVTFTPLAVGVRQATLNIVHDASGSPTTVSVQGTGFLPAGAVCLSASSLAFGSVGIGSTNSGQNVTITNCGTTNLSVTAAAIVGANAGDFHITANSCSSLATGATCSITVNFAPTAGGTRTATLAITNTASGSPHLVSLTGSGSLSQPDAAIGKTVKLKKMVGSGVTNSTGVAQEFIQKIKRVDFAKLKSTKRGLRFFVTLKNIGTSADRFNVQGDGDSAGFRVKYFLGATDLTDITAGVEAGSFASTTLAPGAVTDDSSLIRIEVFADKTVPKGTTKTFTVTFTSGSDPTKVDVVKATVIAK